MKYSNQEIFDKVVERLYDGTGQSVGADGECLYLNSEGLKCSVGIFIPDGHDAQHFTRGVTYLVEQYDDLDFIRGGNIELFVNLQSIHDNEYSWEGRSFDNHDGLQTIADRYSLEFNNPIKEI